VSPFESDRELLDHFRAGDPDALTRVYGETVNAVAQLLHRGALLAAGRRVPGAGSAELERELVQETYLRAFSERARLAYDGLRPYRPYLLRIARNLLIDHWRRAGRELPDEGISELPAEPAPAEENLDFAARLTATRAYLEQLTPDLRSFVELRFIQGLSQREVVKRLEVTRWRARALEKKVQAGLVRHLKRAGLWKD
jgi:RNA polymerase sigma factor (sigma-70 family)